MALGFHPSLAEKSRYGLATMGRKASERAYMRGIASLAREQIALRRKSSNFQPTQRSIGNHAHNHKRTASLASNESMAKGERYAYVPHALTNADCNAKSRQMLLGGLN